MVEHTPLVSATRPAKPVAVFDIEHTGRQSVTAVVQAVCAVANTCHLPGLRRADQTFSGGRCPICARGRTNEKAAEGGAVVHRRSTYSTEADHGDPYQAPHAQLTRMTAERHDHYRSAPKRAALPRIHSRWPAVCFQLRFDPP